MGKMIDYQRPDGQSAKGYLAEPVSGDAAPGVVVIQEWWGLDDEIKAVADKLASEGYRALVPDLYRGEKTLEAKEAEHLMNGLDFADAAGQDIRGAVQYLKATGGVKAGVMGYCMGGALTLLAAVFVSESDVNVTWYGYPPLEFVDAAKIKVPLLGHWALKDEFFPIDGVDALEEKLEAAGTDFMFYRYDTKHAFANEKSATRNIPILAYDPEAAALAWQRTMTFLQEHLG